MESALSDVHWLARSLQEPTAFEVIFDRHFDAVYGYLHRRVGPDLAEELAAETFTLAFERRSSCRASGSVLPWLYGIATNLASQRWRGERRRLRAYGRSGVDRWVANDDEVVARVDGSAELRPRERDALLLYALADLSYEEIALALEVPIGTVGTWLHRAREIARRELTAETGVSPIALSGGDSSG
jgi:RNA polymerase sigma-70 factor (ECF subfamily)